MDIWAPLASGQHPRIYESGRLIYQQGETPGAFFYLLSGTARSFISSKSGGERVLAQHKGGDLMGEASFFDERPRVSSAIAVTRCEIVSIDHNQLNRVFHAHPELSVPMLKYLSKTIRMLSGHVDGMSFQGAEQRIARQLLVLSDDGPIACTHEELGCAIGVSRVTVSRVLSEFARLGWVETGYRCITVKNMKALRTFLTD